MINTVFSVLIPGFKLLAILGFMAAVTAILTVLFLVLVWTFKKLTQ